MKGGQTEDLDICIQRKPHHHVSHHLLRYLDLNEVEKLRLRCVRVFGCSLMLARSLSPCNQMERSLELTAQQRPGCSVKERAAIRCRRKRWRNFFLKKHWSIDRVKVKILTFLSFLSNLPQLQPCLMGGDIIK